MRDRRRPFWYLRRRRESVASEVDEELALHLDLRAQELEHTGLSAQAARLTARREFGDLEATREYCRRQDREKEARMQRGLLLAELMQDLRISLRGLGRAPLMAATIVASVCVGIGGTTVIFGAIEAALLRPLPYARPAEMVRIYTDSPPHKFPFSVADYRALQAQQTQFAEIAGYTRRALAFSDGGVAERLPGREVSWTYFGLLGIRPALGRDFTELTAAPAARAA